MPATARPCFKHASCGGGAHICLQPHRQFLTQPPGSTYIIAREVHNSASQAAAGSAELYSTVSALLLSVERQPAAARQLCTPLLLREACSRGALLRGRCRAGQKGWLQTPPARQRPTAVSGGQSRQRRVCRTSDRRTAGACARCWFGGCVCAAFANGVGCLLFGQGLRPGVRVDGAPSTWCNAVRSSHHAAPVPDDQRVDHRPGTLAAPLRRGGHLLHRHAGCESGLCPRGAYIEVDRGGNARRIRCFDPSLSAAVQSFYVDTMEEDGRRVEQLFRNAETLGIPVEVRPCCFPLSSFVS